MQLEIKERLSELLQRNDDIERELQRINRHGRHEPTADEAKRKTRLHDELNAVIDQIEQLSESLKEK